MRVAKHAAFRPSTYNYLRICFLSLAAAATSGSKRSTCSTSQTCPLHSQAPPTTPATPTARPTSEPVALQKTEVSPGLFCLLESDRDQTVAGIDRTPAAAAAAATTTPRPARPAVKTEDGRTCAFPFIYKKKVYNSCIETKKNYAGWCSTTSNYDDDKKWGNCAAGVDPDDDQHHNHNHNHNHNPRELCGGVVDETLLSLTFEWHPNKRGAAAMVQLISLDGRTASTTTSESKDPKYDKGCGCAATWTSPSDGKSCATLQEGCTKCEVDYGSWCICAENSDHWTYCVHPTDGDDGEQHIIQDGGTFMLSPFTIVHSHSGDLVLDPTAAPKTSTTPRTTAQTEKSDHHPQGHKPKKGKPHDKQTAPDPGTQRGGFAYNTDLVVNGTAIKLNTLEGCGGDLKLGDKIEYPTGMLRIVGFTSVVGDGGDVDVPERHVSCNSSPPPTPPHRHQHRHLQHLHALRSVQGPTCPAQCAVNVALVVHA